VRVVVGWVVEVRTRDAHGDSNADRRWDDTHVDAWYAYSNAWGTHAHVNARQDSKRDYTGRGPTRD
jgi:hypothetical protein